MTVSGVHLSGPSAREGAFRQGCTLLHDPLLWVPTLFTHWCREWSALGRCLVCAMWWSYMDMSVRYNVMFESSLGNNIWRRGE